MEPTTPTTPQPPAAGGKKFSNRTWMMWAGVVAVAIIVIGVAVYWNNRLGTEHDQTNTLSAAQVSIGERGFQPTTIRVKKGQSITWTNSDTRPHTVTSDNTSNQSTAFDSAEPLSTRDTFTATFGTTGTFTYHDQNNPTTFKGTIEVVE